MNERKVLIVTINDYIIYQPTILNLYDALAPYFQTTIISFEPAFLGQKKDNSRNVAYLRTNPFWKMVYSKTDFIISSICKILKKIVPGLHYNYSYYNFYLPKILTRKLKQCQADIVIAVDIPVLSIAQKIFGKVHFLSLEIDVKDPFYKKIDLEKIASVFIQNQIRLDYLFPKKSLRAFFVQNAPIFRGNEMVKQERSGLVWAGSIIERFAVIDCIEFVDKFPQYSLVLKGGGDRKTVQLIKDRYKHLLEPGRLRLDQDYLASELFINYLSKFKIGFCFYSWQLINASFNYRTAPSGKLYMYFAAGTPVVACNIPGFQFVEECGAGILVNDYEPATIAAAIKKIEENYEEFSKKCYEAASYFSFDKTVAPYISFLRNEG